ncbi:MAG: hypothetical protein WBI07_09935 [Mobilitalea sp.]
MAADDRICYSLWGYLSFQRLDELIQQFFMCICENDTKTQNNHFALLRFKKEKTNLSAGKIKKEDDSLNYKLKTIYFLMEI